MRYLIFLPLLTGCGAIDRGMTWLTGNATTVCKGGVAYYQFTSGSSVAYKQDGSLVSCK